MFKIINDVIHITRGDRGVIEFTPDDYTFEVDDIVVFRIFNKKDYTNLH